jgi:hypothetical protein
MLVATVTSGTRSNSHFGAPSSIENDNLLLRNVAGELLILLDCAAPRTIDESSNGSETLSRVLDQVSGK